MSNTSCACKPAFLQHDVTQGASIPDVMSTGGRALVVSRQKKLLLKEFVMFLLPEPFAADRRAAALSTEL